MGAQKSVATSFLSDIIESHSELSFRLMDITRIIVRVSHKNILNVKKSILRLRSKLVII